MATEARNFQFFDSTKAPTTEGVSRAGATLLGADVVFKGTLKSGSDVTIAGIFEGDVACEGRLVVAPGATLTERTLLDPDYIETWSRITPMGRPATVEDIGHAALFLVSDHARHITGQSLIIDGGWTAVSPTPY